MPKRKFEDRSEWSDQKDMILHLYVCEDKPLGEVIKLMTARGFDRTKPQYERSFKDWRITKNIRDGEWKYIFSRLEARQALGRPSIVKVRGIELSDKKIQKQKSKQRQSVFDEHVARYQPSARPLSLPDVEVLTPPSSPKWEGKCHHSGQGDLFPVTHNNEEYSQGFSRQSEPEDILQPPESSLTQSVQPGKLYATIPNQTMGSHERDFLDLYTLPRTASIMQKRHSSFMALEWLSSLVPTLPATGNLPTGTTQESSRQLTLYGDHTETLEPNVIHKVAEKLDTTLAVLVFVRRSWSDAELAALSCLCRLSTEWNFPTFQSFIRRVFIAAVTAGNLRLIEILLDEARIDANTHTEVANYNHPEDDVNPGMEENYTRPTNFPRSDALEKFRKWGYSNVTALQIAVYNRREDIIHILLQHGAHDWSAQIHGFQGSGSGSILDMVIEMGSHKEWLVESDEENQAISSHILQTLLRYASFLPESQEDMFLNALRNAILRDRRDLVDMLCMYRPTLMNFAKKSAYLLWEAAATLIHPGMIDFLIEKGFRIKEIGTKLSDYLGSPVAVAASFSNYGLITYLLHKGAKRDEEAFGMIHADSQTRSLTLLEKKLEDIREKTALEYAFSALDEPLIRLLMYSGANPSFFQEYNFKDTHNKVKRDHLLIEAIVRSTKPCPVFISIPGKGRALSLHGVRHCYWLDVLCDAILRGDCWHVEQLVDEGWCFGSGNCINRALILAVRQRSNRMVQIFLNAGGDPFARLEPTHQCRKDLDKRHKFKYDHSAFEEALGSMSLPLIEKFVSHPISALDEEEQVTRRRQMSYAYTTAICIGDKELEKVITEGGLDPSKIDEIMGPNYVQQRLHFSLQHAAASGEKQEIIRLLDIGASPNSPNKDTANTSGILTPLLYAVKSGNLYIVRKLLEAGADVNAPAHPREGCTALQQAVCNSDSEMVDLLLKAKADVNGPPAAYRGVTAIEAAAAHGCMRVFYLILLQKPNIRGENDIIFRKMQFHAQNTRKFEILSVAQSEFLAQGGDMTTIFSPGSLTRDELLFHSEKGKQEYLAYLAAKGDEERFSDEEEYEDYSGDVDQDEEIDSD